MILTGIPRKKRGNLPPGSHPDGELLELGERFIRTAAEALRADEAFFVLHDQVLDKVEAVATWPADKDRWTQEDAKAYCVALSFFSIAAGEAYRDADKIRDRAWNEFDRIIHAIRASNPKTPEGLSVKALVSPLLDDDGDAETG
jgi:hypothetical protein